jgi:hypothetical protein
MTIYANILNVTGELRNVPSLYTNTISAPSMSNIEMNSDIRVNGNVIGSGRLDMGATIFATFRLNSNMSFSSSPEIYGGSNFVLDFTSTDMTAMTGMQMAVPPNQVFNYNTGVVTVPVSGLYSLYMQAAFSNDPRNSLYKNGIYYKFLNMSHSNVRMAPSYSPIAPVHHTNYIGYFLAGDQIRPTFYCDDPGCVLLGNGETIVSFAILSTSTPTHSNYYRI